MNRYDLSYCEDALNAQVGVAGEAQRALTQRWQAYWDLLAAKHVRGQGFSDGFPHDAIQQLQAAGVITPDTHALDIGCGAGSYTADLARCCRSVTAVDYAPAMLEALTNRLQTLQLANVTPQCALFEQLPDTPAYDLAFAAMCPAIGDAQSLLRMERMSRAWCALITVAKGSHSRIRQELRALLTDTRLPGLSPDVQYPFNYLYARGRLPNLRFEAYESRPCMCVEEAIHQYHVYYDVFGFDTPLHHARIAEYLRDHAQDGRVEDVVTYRLALMWWHI